MKKSVWDNLKCITKPFESDCSDTLSFLSACCLPKLFVSYPSEFVYGSYPYCVLCSSTILSPLSVKWLRSPCSEEWRRNFLLELWWSRNIVTHSFLSPLTTLANKIHVYIKTFLSVMARTFLCKGGAIGTWSCMLLPALSVLTSIKRAWQDAKAVILTPSKKKRRRGCYSLSCSNLALNWVV